MDGKEAQEQVHWMPTTPVKPILPKPVPIYTPGEKNQVNPHADGAVACHEFPAGTVPAATIPNIGGDGGNFWVQTAYDDVSSFSELLFRQETSANPNAPHTGNDDGLRIPFIPSLNSQFKVDPVNNPTSSLLWHRQISLEGSLYNDNAQDSQGILHIACCSKSTSQDTTLTPENAIRAEGRQIASMQINMEEKNPEWDENNVPAEKLEDDGTRPNVELCNPVVEFSAVSTSFKDNHYPDKGSNHDINLNTTPQQKPRRRKHRPKVVIEGKPKRTPKQVTRKPVQSKENLTGKRKYVRKKGLNKTSTPPAEVAEELIEEIVPKSGKRSCRRPLNFDIGGTDESSAGRENATAHLGKDGVVVQETNVGLDCNLTAFMTQASNNHMSMPQDTQAMSTSPRKTPPGKKPKENPPAKRKYVRRKGKNSSSAPPNEVTGQLTEETTPGSAKTCCSIDLNFDMVAKDESSAGRESATVHMGKEIGLISQERNVGLALDLNTNMKQASNKCMPSPEDTQPPSKTDPHEAKPKEKPTSKRKYVRRKDSTPAEMREKMTEPMMSKSNKMSCIGSLNVDIEARDENFAGGENTNVHISKENSVVVEETQVSLAYDPRTPMNQALHNCISLPEDAQDPSSSSKSNPHGSKSQEKSTGKRKNVGRIVFEKTSTPPTEIIAESNEPIMPESTKISHRMSSNLDVVARDECYACTENLDLHISNKNRVAIDKMHAGVGPVYEQNSSMNPALYMSLAEDTQAPGTFPPKTNPHGAKLNVNSFEKEMKSCQATAQDGHGNSAKVQLKSVAQSNANDSYNSQNPLMRLPMVGSKRKRSGSVRGPVTGSMNLIGAHSNELSSYQAMGCVPFPNIQKKRRSEKGKSSNNHITSSMTITKDPQFRCPQENAQADIYASGSSYFIPGSEYNRVPATESVYDTQDFYRFLISLRNAERLRSPAPVLDFASTTGTRNCDAELNYTEKQLSISDRQTFLDAERKTGPDAFVEETGASLTKKRQNKKRSALSSSANSSKKIEMQQHHSFRQENYHLQLGRSSDNANEIMQQTIQYYIDALAEQFRQLNMDTEARDLALHGQNALVPYKQLNQKQNALVHGDGAIIPFQGSFDPIKKQRPRPKVDVDEETDRVWKLLMLDINSHGIDGTDEEKAKWWEEERNVFRGRADSFIARMHLVQGDRRFSPWKGSVVDSVVGVFLTQNVTDHLSSSAFMSLAARFPPKSHSMSKTYHDESTSPIVNQPQVQLEEPEENIEWDVKTSNQSVYDQSSMTMGIIEQSEEREAVNSNDSCRITDSVQSLTEESNCLLSESSQRNIGELHGAMRSGLMSAVTEDGEEKSCYEGVRKELNDMVSSQCSVISSQVSRDLSSGQNPEKIGLCSDSNSQVEVLSTTAKSNSLSNITSFSTLLEMASSKKLHEVISQSNQSTDNLRDANVTQVSAEVREVYPSITEASSRILLKNKDENDMNRPVLQSTESTGRVAITHSQSMVSELHLQEQSSDIQQNFYNMSGQAQDLMQKERKFDLGHHEDAFRNETNEISSGPIKVKRRGQREEKKDDFNWDSLRIKAQAMAGKREKTENTMDSLNWEAVRCADVKEIANAIKERGMNNRLAERIKNFLNRLVEEHGSIDLEWLRDVPPDQAKEYLLSIKGLGLKSVECVRLLTLHHLAFPVDTNVGRIAVRLGWVPLQPLPESLQLHLLELYPILESIQKYLWPRLCKLDQRTLYELHYQLITFGKVFCTKSKPNCNACPMRGECRHFASAFASARLALPGPEQRSIVSISGNNVTNQNPSGNISQLYLPLPENTNQGEEIQQTEVSRQLQPKSETNICQPIIEEPRTPEPECSQVSQNDIEDAFYMDSCEIPTIKLDIEEFTLNLQNYMQENMELQEGEVSKALVALNPEAASIPVPKLKNVSRLRTEHCVYELPDTHPLLEGWDTREPDDPGKYLLAIWTPGETANSTQPPERKCSSQEFGQLCNEKECFSCNSFREANSQIVRGTLLIPCRTAMRGSFPLNGTYFQVNEVFADHKSSLHPISVPRSWIWHLNRRTVYFGTSVTSIFKGLSTQEIQQCFWRGYVCVRGFDRESRAPRPLMARLHISASKVPKNNESTRKKSTPAKTQQMKSDSEHPELLSNTHNLEEHSRA